MNTCALKILAVSKSKSHLVSILATLLVLTLCINTAVAQGVLINGANQTGTINTNILADSYTFTANTGDSINLRLGWTGTQTGNLELFGPNGALLKRTAGSTDDLVTETAATDGTYTVLVSGYDNGGVAIGTYVLNLSQVPEPFIVPAGYGGGPLTNGANATGTITLGRQDLWTFTANTGDSISLRLGWTGTQTGNLELFGPNGALLKQTAGSTDDLVTETAATNGTYTVLVSGYDNGGVAVATYVLNLSQVPEPFIVPAGYGGGPLTNGANATGTITLGRQDLWTFTANTGDSINLRLGWTGTQNGNLYLYGPTGALLKSAIDSTDDQVTETAATSGTYTVLVNGYDNGGVAVATYVLNLSQVPEPFIVPAGYGGGPLTNGANATGTITLGRQDLWTFTANAGDSINLRLGWTGTQNGNLYLYGPTGALLKSAQDSTDDQVTETAATSGTYTVLVNGYDNGGVAIAMYVLNLSQVPEPFIVSSGDQGGAMAGDASYAGTITLGDQDMWAFTACTGDPINLGLHATNFNGNLFLYGPNGTLLKSAQGSTALSIAYTATNCGTFAVLVSAYSSGGTGTYGLTANGLADELKVCPPLISGANLTVNGVGGPTNAGFVLYSATNIATPLGLWTPVLTNQFNQFGVFGYTNIYNPSQRQQFYRFLVP